VETTDRGKEEAEYSSGNGKLKIRFIYLLTDKNFLGNRKVFSLKTFTINFKSLKFFIFFFEF
jgi:hypothetical protein